MATTRLAVFCGSSPGAHEAYVVATRRLGTALAARGLVLHDAEVDRRLARVTTSPAMGR